MGMRIILGEESLQETYLHIDSSKDFLRESHISFRVCFSVPGFKCNISDFTFTFKESVLLLRLHLDPYVSSSFKKIFFFPEFSVDTEITAYLLFSVYVSKNSKYFEELFSFTLLILLGF